MKGSAVPCRGRVFEGVFKRVLASSGEVEGNGMDSPGGRSCAKEEDAKAAAASRYTTLFGKSYLHVLFNTQNYATSEVHDIILMIPL